MTRWSTWRGAQIATAIGLMRMGAPGPATKLLGVFLSGLRIQDLPVVLADVEVLVIVLGEDDLLFVVLELQVGDIVLPSSGTSSPLALFFSRSFSLPSPAAPPSSCGCARR